MPTRWNVQLESAFTTKREILMRKRGENQTSIIARRDAHVTSVLTPDSFGLITAKEALFWPSDAKEHHEGRGKCAL